jgi:excinuclease ABC subunit B
VPQIGAMYAGDRARKDTLVEHGFRLPSAVDNRPLKFEEFQQRIGQTLYTSATPGKYELERSGKPIEMIIRPTGLVDPEIIIRPIVSVGKYSKGKSGFYYRSREVTKSGARSMVTVLTKKMAEDLTQFLVERGSRRATFTAM